VAGLSCALLYTALAWKAKETPELGHALEILITSVSAAGGIRTCQYVISGKLFEVFKAAAACKSGIVTPSTDDGIYFFFGGIALVWISVATVGRLIWKKYTAAFPVGRSVA
jgi:hypothetical protein